MKQTIREVRPRPARRLIGLVGVGILVAASLAACGGSSDKAGSDKDKVLTLTVTTGEVAPAYAHVYLAQAAGIFAKEHLKVKTIAGAGSTTLPAIVSGQADLGFFGTSAAFGPQAQGKPISIVWNFGGGGFGGYVAINADDKNSIKSVKDLAGKRVGVIGGTGSSYGAAAQYADETGIKYQMVPFTNSSTIVAALSNGSISAAVGAKEWFLSGIDHGLLSPLVDTGDSAVRTQLVGGYYAENCVFGLKSNLEKKRPAVERFLAAMVQADKLIHDSTDAQLVTQLKKLKAFDNIDASTLASQFAATRPFYTPAEGEISTSMWSNSLPKFAKWNIEGFNPSSSLFSYSKIVDMSYLKGATSQN